MTDESSGKSAEKKTRTIYYYEDYTQETFELRQISDEELQQVLAEHKKWLDSEGTDGKQADLRKTDLEGRDLSEATLVQAHLQKAYLWGAHLQKADLRGAHLQKADLRGAHLQKADLRGAHLQKADLRLAHLQKAYLRGAHLQKAYLWEADLQKADLRLAHLQKVYLRGAHLQKADLGLAHLQKANIGEADLQKAYLRGAHLQKADLRLAHLQKADLWEADLQKADLRGAHLQKADLGLAHLQKADLWEADLQKADLRAANLEETAVFGVKYDRNTLCLGIRVSSCYGSAMFKAFAQHQDFLEELQTRRWDNERLKFKLGKKKFDLNNWGKALYNIWNIFADCGRTPWRWMGWSAIFMLCFALLYWPTPDCFPDWFSNFTSKHGASFQQTATTFSEDPLTLGGALYFSVVTFTTLGFGDVVAANDMARLLVVLEVILGYVMLGGLISIFATLITRRG
ncbi:Ion transport 2 domain protein [Desulfatibacillum aliphaticivorans]|uniref:Ion transport 2 domain protein n=1 Tax=Desulfatibacillum aliphaticivorans TaxID=218208 RepID=B8FC21_DESAL|nr:pentapeptide repeat-containing protein [Desulfatibacillum aliphaticivorans]ACL05226.1 Ion transport 2 domain protein [Desulfatibacillum aliphaticivorans]